MLQIDGYDIVGVARNDFSLAVGYLGQLDHPVVEEAVMKVIAHAKKAGVAPTFQFWATDKVKQYVDAGARVISLGTDHDLFKQKCTETIDKTKKLQCEQAFAQNVQIPEMSVSLNQDLAMILPNPESVVSSQQ